MLKLIDTSIFTDIANAIREKLGSDINYKPSQMAEAIKSIPTDVGENKIYMRIINGESVGTKTEIGFEMIPRIPNNCTVMKISIDCDNGGFTEFGGDEVIGYTKADWGDDIILAMPNYDMAFTHIEFYVGVIPGSMTHYAFWWNFKKSSTARNCTCTLECSDEINRHRADILCEVPAVDYE